MSAVLALDPAVAHRAAPRRIRVALAGCGTVGGALVRLLEGHRPAIAARHGLELELVRVLVRDVGRDRGGLRFRPGVLTDDLDRFLGTDADVVVEAVGGLEPAWRIADAVLARGAHFVTANKALVAARGGDLAARARRSGAALRCDAAVGGGVPALRLIDDALGGAAPAAVRGILNGTSNYVLTLLERGAALEAALADARRRGFAEADAARDLDGRDAADKIAIVAWAAFGIAPERVAVRRRGLLPDPARLVRLASALGGRLRLVAECELVDDGRAVVASVEPVVVGADDALGRTAFEDNRVELHAGWSAPLCASGPGAGGAPTAAALLSDLLAPLTPPRERPAAPAPADDARPFRWAVGAGASTRALRAGLAALAERGVVADEAGRRAGEAWAITPPLPWRALEPALAALAAAGADPVVARLERRADARASTAAGAS